MANKQVQDKEKSNTIIQNLEILLMFLKEAYLFDQKQ